MSMAAGRAVLRVIDSAGLQGNCAAVGGHLLERLRCARVPALCARLARRTAGWLGVGAAKCEGSRVGRCAGAGQLPASRSVHRPPPAAAAARPSRRSTPTDPQGAAGQARRDRGRAGQGPDAGGGAGQGPGHQGGWPCVLACAGVRLALEGAGAGLAAWSAGLAGSGCEATRGPRPARSGARHPARPPSPGPPGSRAPRPRCGRLRRALQEPAAAEVAQVFERCKDLGLLLGKGGARSPSKHEPAGGRQRLRGPSQHRWLQLARPLSPRPLPSSGLPSAARHLAHAPGRCTSRHAPSSRRPARQRLPHQAAHVLDPGGRRLLRRRAGPGAVGAVSGRRASSAQARA